MDHCQRKSSERRCNSFYWHSTAFSWAHKWICCVVVVTMLGHFDARCPMPVVNLFLFDFVLCDSIKLKFIMFKLCNGFLQIHTYLQFSCIGKNDNEKYRVLGTGHHVTRIIVLLSDCWQPSVFVWHCEVFEVKVGLFSVVVVDINKPIIIYQCSFFQSLRSLPFGFQFFILFYVELVTLSTETMAGYFGERIP